MSEPRLRQAARAVVVDPDNRVLLVRFEFPARVVWATPGGGIEEGETDEHALHRELLEETGLGTFELGPLVWLRTHLFELAGGFDGQHERYYLVRTPRFEPLPRLGWDELRLEGMTAVRWWTLDELEHGEETFAPRRLPAFVGEIVRGGPPAEPIDVGV